jgi:myosin-5
LFFLYFVKYMLTMTKTRLSPNQIQKLLNQYLVADYEQPINGEIMKAVASRVTDPKTDVLLLPAVDMDDSGPYEIAEPRVITALETYTPSWLQTPRLKRLAEIVSAQAVMQQALDAGGAVAAEGYDGAQGQEDGEGGDIGDWSHLNNGINGGRGVEQAAGI